jgi:hypothetical protein
MISPDVLDDQRGASSDPRAIVAKSVFHLLEASIRSMMRARLALPSKVPAGPAINYAFGDHGCP